MRLVLAVLVVLSLGAAPAHAVPGDTPAAPVAPADGATVDAGTAGVTLVFTCPPYRQSPSEDVPVERLIGYGVRVARDAAFTDELGTSQIQPGPAPGQCSAVVQRKGGGGPLLEPGPYFWRVDRACFCGGGADSESSVVARFTIATPDAKMRAAVPGAAYRGFPVLATLTSVLPDGQEVVLERKVGAAWRPVATKAPVRISDGRASAPVTLTGSRAQVRWRADRGGGPSYSPAVTVRVRPARGWTTSARDDGAYTGSSQSAFRVVRKGREVRGFRIRMTVYCVVGTNVANNRTISATAAIPRIRVAPDGRFLASTTIAENDVVVRGRLRNRKVTGGRVDLAFSSCSGSRTFTASRR